MSSLHNFLPKSRVLFLLLSPLAVNYEKWDSVFLSQSSSYHLTSTPDDDDVVDGNGWHYDLNYVYVAE